MATAAQAPLTVRLSKEISESLLSHVEETGAAVPEAVNRFVEDAVQMRLLDLNVQKIRDAFADISEQEVEGIVQEAVTWARSPEGRRCE